MATSIVQQISVPRDGDRDAGSWYKRALDLVVLIGAHLILLPLFLLIWIAIPLAIWLDDRGPVLHRRRAIGSGGKAFDMIKFRTMVVDADQWLARDSHLRARFAEAYKLQDDPRVTRVGRWLRRWSLDELPQLLNVLKGEMSLVGPRPHAECELAKYGPWRDRVLSVRPGLTGLWQVLRHDEPDYARRVSLDMYYLDRQSLALDLLILLRTLPSVFAGRGAY